MAFHPVKTSKASEKPPYTWFYRIWLNKKRRHDGTRWLARYAGNVLEPLKW